MTDLRPQSDTELAAMIADASDVLRIQGGGTRPIGNSPSDAQTLFTDGLNGIELYEPGALTLVAKAGTPLSDIHAALAAEGQRLAFEPMDHRGLLGTTGTPTVGGMVATNASGPRRIQVGACRDSLLGVKFADGNGQLVSNGGRVMKNVTGYDLVKLLAGSYGTLGVLTQVALKVLPQSATTGVLSLEGLSDVDAVSALSKALGSPFEVTGAAHTQSGPNDAPTTMIRIEGSEASVAYRADQLQSVLKAFGQCRLDIDPATTIPAWEGVRDVAAFHNVAGAVWRLSVKPSDAPAIVAACPGAQALYDWGGGLIWLHVPAGSDLTGHHIRRALDGLGGHATLIRGGDAEIFHPQPKPLAELQSSLRLKFDPRAILNRGLMDPVT